MSNNDKTEGGERGGPLDPTGSEITRVQKFVPDPSAGRDALPFHGGQDSIPESYVSGAGSPQWHGGPDGDWFAIHNGVHWRIGRRFHVWRDGRPLYGGPFDGHHFSFAHAAEHIAKRLPKYPRVSRWARWWIRLGRSL